jgi:hypothetical protein
MTPFEKAQEELRELGIYLEWTGTSFRVKYARGKPSGETVTDDLEEALSIGRRMSVGEVSAEKPLGPMGSGSTRRARMYRHNRMIAARRIKDELFSRVVRETDED